ncbi:MAG: hypothetical protein K6E85_16800 [Lachnospiraceae bacterium]|nr:hypothetical protein [Lachnospiraceae bacterium]
MDSYIDDKYTILNGVLLACTDESPDPVIPSSVNGHPITRICAGCVVNRKAKTITVSEGIEEIGESALIMRNRKVREIRLPSTLTSCDFFMNPNFWNEYFQVRLKRRFSTEEFDNIRQNSLLLDDGRRILNEDDSREIFYYGVNENDRFAVIAPAASICREMHGLYVFAGMQGDYYTSVFQWNKDEPDQFLFKDCRKRIDTTNGFLPDLFRRSLVKILMEEPFEQVYSMNDELENDKEPRTNGGMTGSGTGAVIIYFDENDVTRDSKGVIVNLHLDCRQIYFPALRKIVIGGKKYYIYSENFLTCRKEKPYIRYDYPDMIFDENANIADIGIARKVMAKYKLMQMLV